MRVILSMLGNFYSDLYMSNVMACIIILTYPGEDTIYKPRKPGLILQWF